MITEKFVMGRNSISIRPQYEKYDVCPWKRFLFFNFFVDIVQYYILIILSKDNRILKMLSICLLISFVFENAVTNIKKLSTLTYVP